MLSATFCTSEGALQGTKRRTQHRRRGSAPAAAHGRFGGDRQCVDHDVNCTLAAKIRLSDAANVMINGCTPCRGAPATKRPSDSGWTNRAVTTGRPDCKPLGSVSLCALSSLDAPWITPGG